MLFPGMCRWEREGEGERETEREGRDRHRKEEYGKMKGEAGEGASVSVFASKAFQTFAVQML